MADANPYADAVAAGAKEHSSSSEPGAAEQTEELELSELVSQVACRSCQIDLKVIHNQIIDYTYTWNGKQVETQKLQVILQSKRPEQYCMGFARLQKQDKAELQKMKSRFQVGNTWKFTAITLMSEKSAFIHTPCRIAVDLRKSKTQALLQSMSFPSAPAPTVTIADILQLRETQRFDLMAIVATILEERKGPFGLQIYDVRLVDGSEQSNSDTTKYASLPITLFLKDEAEITLLKNSVGNKPLLFMCLNGTCKNGEVCVSTVKDQFWFREASGAKSAAMAQQAEKMCNGEADLKDVASLPTFTPTESKDFITPVATLTACQLVDEKHFTLASILGDATEHLYQLNHVHVVPPSKTENVKTKDGRLFARLEVWDCSKKITLCFRSRAMLQLAGFEVNQADEYMQALNDDELRHPLLASLRLQVQLRESKSPVSAGATEQSDSQPDKAIAAVVVEAMSCMDTDMGKEAVQAMRGLLTGLPQTSERMTAMPLCKLKPSPFYNMIADGSPVDKVLAMLRFTQRSNGKQHAGTFRVVSARVQDAAVDDDTTLNNTNCFGTIALCTCEKVNDFSPPKNATVIAVISKVVAPALPQQHAADLYVEAIEVIENKEDIARARTMMHQLQEISNFERGDSACSSQVAWEQRKCRRLVRYPTMDSGA